MSDHTIHPTAIVEKGAKLGKGVKVGPFSHIGAHVELGNDCILESHVVIGGHTTIGESTHIFPFASIGLAPQDLKYHGEKSSVTIGKHTTIREHVTINPGTSGGVMKTMVGDHCLLMVGAHVAHDCIVGNHVIMANNATLAGHVEVGDHAIIGGLSAVHQFVRIGAHAMIGGMSGIESDIIPYGQASGERAALVGLNLVGLKRRNFERDDINTLRSAYRMLFSPEGTFSEKLEDVTAHFKENPLVTEVLHFIRSTSSRSLCQPKNGLK